MLQFSDKDIQEIAEQLNCGFRCYYHRETGELLFLPDEMADEEVAMEAWGEERAKLEENFEHYEAIEPMGSRASFQVMADFAEHISGNDRLQSQLISALNNNHPFRNFKYIIDHSGSYREQWFAFRNEKLIEWVRERLNPDTFDFEEQDES